MSAYHQLVERQRQAREAEAADTRQAERFVDLAGAALEAAEALRTSYAQPWSVMYDAAVSLREAADGLAELATELE